MEQSGYAALFEPITIGNVTIRNRIAMAPTTTNFAQSGYPTEQFVAFLAARAKGGTGLMITPPALNLFPGASAHLVFPLLSEKAHIPMWNEVVETIHAFGAKAFGQVMAGGSGRQNAPGVVGIAPSPVPITEIPEENIPQKSKDYEARKGLPSLWVQYKNMDPPREMTLEEIVWLEDAFAHTVGLMKAAGFDGAELHFGHGYLGASFLSPRTNIRTDRYGGNTENRARLLLNALRKAKDRAGKDFVVGARISGDEHMPGGLGIEESARIAKMAENEGLDYLHLTGGCWEATKYYLPDEDGTMLSEAEIMKVTLSIPVITPAIHKPENAESAVTNCQTDMISLCRPLIADPEWPNKVARGDAPKIKKCIRCLGCLQRLRRSLGLRCEVNREVGQERYIPEYNRRNAPHWRQFTLPE